MHNPCSSYLCCEAKTNPKIRHYVSAQIDELAKLSSEFNTLQRGNMKLTTQSASKDCYVKVC